MEEAGRRAGSISGAVNSADGKFRFRKYNPVQDFISTDQLSIKSHIQRVTELVV